MSKLVISIMSAIFIMASGSGLRAGEPVTLSQAELAKLFPGNFTAIVSDAVAVQISAKGNGTLLGQMPGRKDSGHWSVKSGTLCIVWSVWLGGKASCSKVVSGDGWYHGNGVKFRKI